MRRGPPPAAGVWTSLLSPRRGRDPEGLWNVLTIDRDI
jgi:hypothetical protein